MVAIKDMEMPINCYACELTYYDETMNSRCSKTKHVIEYNLNERADDCPLVEIEERKVGKWVKSEIGGAKVCSICQAHMGLSNFKYCPNCGSKMSDIPTGSD